MLIQTDCKKEREGEKEREEQAIKQYERIRELSMSTEYLMIRRKSL